MNQKKYLTYFMLQLFAEDSVQEEQSSENSNDSQTGQKQDTPKPKYTDKDVDKILNRKFAEWQMKKQREIDEAKHLASMSAKETAELERDMMRKKLEELMNERKLVEMSKTARSILSKKNINVNDELLSLLVSEDADKTKKAIDSFVLLFQDAFHNRNCRCLKRQYPKCKECLTRHKRVAH